MIPDLFKSVVGSFLRWGLQGVFTWLTAKEILTEGQTNEIYIWAAGAVAMLLWSIYQKYLAGKILSFALQAPAGTDLAKVKNAVKGNRAAMIIPLFLLLAVPGLTGCPDNQIREIAKNVDRVADLVQDGREIRDELFVQNVIDRSEAAKLTTALHKIHSANKTFRARAITYQNGGDLTPEGKADLRKLADDISGAVSDLIQDGTFGVKNPDAQARIQAVIGTIRQAVGSILDSIDLLKVKKPATTAMGVEFRAPALAGITPLAFLPIALLMLRKVVNFINEERKRTGMTTEEIFDQAGEKIEALDLAFLEDFRKYGPPGDPE